MCELNFIRATLRLARGVLWSQQGQEDSPITIKAVPDLSFFLPFFELIVLILHVRPQKPQCQWTSTDLSGFIGDVCHWTRYLLHFGPFEEGHSGREISLQIDTRTKVEAAILW